ncbi:hypothetical protein BD779DRAFT_572992 [Infundibulicybe gibba]|nr:hypothetical protein BD779DRAFT_572992 [Infundibulicybe gibba]
MCRMEVFGDWYRACGHFIKAYYSGVKYDCESSTCRLSQKHMHKAVNCPCPEIEQDERRIQNMFHASCESCRAAEFARLSIVPFYFSYTIAPCLLLVSESHSPSAALTWVTSLACRYVQQNTLPEVITVLEDRDGNQGINHEELIL